MGESVLTEDTFYDAADVANRSINIEQISFVGFSVQQFRDISIIKKAIGLRVVTFRLCGMTEFPLELVELPLLQNLDLSGNQIETLPDPETLSSLHNLRTLNLNENKIRNMKEVYNLRPIAQLTQLSLTGNVCMSSNDAFNRIVKTFPGLLVLNDLIITSQHRAFISDLAVYDPGSTLPIQKVDDYFFLYVRYMHSATNERYVRKANAEGFCVNRVLRRYSAALKIQSVFRGYVVRQDYLKMRAASIFIQSVVRFWYFKRLRAANLIRRNFLYFLTRQKIKFVRAVRLIQSKWRQVRERRAACISVFEVNEGFDVYLAPTSRKVLDDFILKHLLDSPENISDTDYLVLKEGPSKKLKLPGSPHIYYGLENTLLIRRILSKEPSQNSIWCGHRHIDTHQEIHVTRDGINSLKPCPFTVVRYMPYHPNDPVSIQNKYQRIVRYHYSSYEKFKRLMEAVFNEKPQLRLISHGVITRVTAQICLQSTARMVVLRSRMFKEIKAKALENRAIISLRYSLRTNNTIKAVRHVVSVYRYFKSIQNQSVFYVTQAFLRSLVKTKRSAKFGFSAEKSLVVEPESNGFLETIIPAAKPMFELSDLLSIFKVGVIMSPAQLPDNTKWIKRYKVMRIAFATPEEARRRLALYAWLTGDYVSVMTEKEVHEFLAASVIKAAWNGFSTRSYTAHITTQLNIVLKMIKPKKKTTGTFAKVVEKILPPPKKLVQVDPARALSKLRGEYMPWEKDLEQYKTRKETTKKITKEPIEIKNMETEEHDITEGTLTTQPILPESVNNYLKTDTLTQSEMGDDSFPKSNNSGYFQDNYTEPSKTGSSASRSFTPEDFPLPSMPPVEIGRLYSSMRSRTTILNDRLQAIKEQEEMDKKRQASNLINRRSIPISSSMRNTSSIRPYVSILPPPILSATKLSPREPQKPATPEAPDVIEQESVEEVSVLKVSPLKLAFTKLVRLHQIGEEIKQMAAVDNTIENNRLRAQKLRDENMQLHSDVCYNQRYELTQTIQRNKIYQTEISELAEQIKEKALKEKTKRAREIRQDRARRHQKLETSLSFGKQFVSVSRQLAQKIEVAQRKKKEQLRETLKLEATDGIRLQASQARENAKSSMSEIEDRKRRLAILDRAVTLGKAKRMDEIAEQRREQLKEAKRKEKERRKLFSKTKEEIREYGGVIVLEDPIEEAIRVISNYIGGSMGSIESRLTVEILSGIGIE